MPFPTGDLYRVNVGGAIAGENWSIDQWFTLTGLTGLPTQAQLDASAVGSANAFNSQAWAPTVSTGISTFNSTSTALSRATGSLYRAGSFAGSGNGLATSPASGTKASGLHPGYCAIVITTRTATAGRSGRGRVYVPAGANVLASNLQWASADLVSLLAFYKAYLTTMALANTNLPGNPTSTPVVVSQRHALASPILSLKADSIPDTQHGRTRRVTATFAPTLNFP